MEQIINEELGIEQFEKIQARLRENNDTLFNAEIAAKTKDALSNWIGKEYPSLKNDIEDICFNVFRRLKYWIRYKAESSEYKDWKKVINKFLKQECDLATPSEENKMKNLGLTKPEFKSLLLKLQKGDEGLIEKVYLANFKKSLSILISAYNCTYDEAYECTMDALIDLRKDLIKGKIRYGNLGSYFNRRAALVLFKKRKSAKLNLVSLTDEFEFQDEYQTDAVLESAQVKDMIVIAINKLGSECQSIIKQYYFEEIKLEEIATKLDKTHVAIRKQISRCRDKLRNYLSKDYYLTFEVKKG